MTWITDNPIPLFILGLMTQIILGLILWQTGRGWVMFLMIASGISSIGLIVAEICIVSPSEEIASTLDEIAASLVSNKPENVLAFIAPEKTVLRANAVQQLKRVRIHEAAVTGDLRVSAEALPESDQQTASASFNARIKANFLKDTSPYEQLVQRVKVDFRKEKGRWLVTHYVLNPR